MKFLRFENDSSTVTRPHGFAGNVAELINPALVQRACYLDGTIWVDGHPNPIRCTRLQLTINGKTLTYDGPGATAAWEQLNREASQ